MSKHKGSRSVDLTERDGAGSDRTPKKLVDKSSSIRSNMSDDDENNVPNADTYNNSPRTRIRARAEADNDPYVALRIADSPRRIGGTAVHGYQDSRYRRERSTDGKDVPNTDPYVPLKIAGNHCSSVEVDDEVVYDSEGSSGFDEEHEDDEEDASDSAGSRDEKLDDELSELEGNYDSEDNEKRFSTGHVRVFMGGSETRNGNGERFSVTGNATQDSPVYARLPLSVGDAEERGRARVSVAGSEIDYGREGHVRVSVAGSEIDYGRDGYAKVSVAGSEADHKEDIYARLSIAGSETENGRGEDGDIAGYGHGKDRYARVSVAGSDAGYGNNFSLDVSRYARLTVLQSKGEPLVLPFETGQQSKEDEGLSDKESKHVEDEELWQKENETYMDCSLEIRAKLEYRVRVLSISPLFELKDRQLASFSDLYRNKFGEQFEATGFTSVARLCRSMPHVQRIQLEETGKLVLVDSSQNRRAVSGIRSGLRRIVYDILKSGEALSDVQFQEKCSELLGQPLVEVLCEHGYEHPNVESLVNDMLDIAAFDAQPESRVCLCKGAEDPALTDGLLIKSTNVPATPKPSNILEPRGLIAGVDERAGTLKDSDISGEDSFPHHEGLKLGSTLTLRGLKNELRRFGSLNHSPISSPEDEILQARLRMRILLAFHDSGRGVQVSELPDLYEKCFGRCLDLQPLRVGSVLELARNWHDIFLFQDPKPGWVFLVPSQANRRLLNTLRTGLRSTVFSVLVETYPEGLDPLDFLHRLQQVMSGELWEVLDATGYICSGAERSESMLSISSRSDFQLVDFEEICILLDDMMDFVRLGSNEDGSVVVKLKTADVPLVDLSDCKLEETDVRSFDELFVNLMMIAVDDDYAETSGADDNSSENDGLIHVGHVQSLVNSFEGSVGLRSAHSQTPDSLKLKHEIRLMLGCPEYFEGGLIWNKMGIVYKDRTGLELGSKAKVKSLLRGMPDIVTKHSFAGDTAHLSKTSKNLRILSSTKAGFRQVLFWALVKNPGGVWANLLEGWFTDFSGVSLAASLQSHGYEMSKCRPFFPVHAFLRDMSDLLLKKSGTHEVYTWAGEVKDPVHEDASLLGLSELLIQYDPLKSELEVALPGEAGITERDEEKILADFEAGHYVPQHVGNEESDGEDQHVADFEEVHGSQGGYANESTGVSDKQDFDTAHRFGSGDGDESAAVSNCQRLSLTEAEVQQVDQECADDIPKVGVDGISMMHVDLVHVIQEDFVDETSMQDVDEIPKEVVDEIAKDDVDWKFDHEGSESNYGSDSAGYEEVVGDGQELEREGAAVSAEGYAQLRVAGKLEEDPGDGQELEMEGVAANSAAYAQLRVAGKGRKVNLDEWQFTDSEEEENSQGNDVVEIDSEDEEDSEYSEDEINASKDQAPALPRDANSDPRVKVSPQDARRAWVLPNKGIPWK